MHRRISEYELLNKLFINETLAGTTHLPTLLVMNKRWSAVRIDCDLLLKHLIRNRNQVGLGLQVIAFLKLAARTYARNRYCDSHGRHANPRPSRLLKYPLRKRKAMLGEFDFSDFLFAS